MMKGQVQVLNWNIAGAKYLELPKGRREDFRRRLNAALTRLIETDKPAVVTIQEVVRYHEQDNEADAVHVIDVPDGYSYFPLWLIDTRHQSAKGKWDRVRERIGRSTNSSLAQRNTFLMRKDIAAFRAFQSPKMNRSCQISNPVEIVKRGFGLCSGARDAEPFTDKVRVAARAILLRGGFWDSGSSIWCVIASLCSRANRRIAMIYSSRLSAAACAAYLLVIARTIKLVSALCCRREDSEAPSALEKFLLLSGLFRHLSSWLEREVLRVPLPDFFPDSRPECKHLFHGAVVQKSLGLCRATPICTAVV